MYFSRMVLPTAYAVSSSGITPSSLNDVFGDKDYIRWHDLRASYTSILLDKGINIKYLQNSLGHSNPKTTMESYTRVLSTTSTKVRDALSNIFSG